MYIINIGNEETTKVVAEEKLNNHSLVKAEWLFFYCLCNNTKMVITKATFMIVIPINP